MLYAASTWWPFLQLLTLELRPNSVQLSDSPRRTRPYSHIRQMKHFKPVFSLRSATSTFTHKVCLLVFIASIIGLNDYLNIPLSQAPLVQKEVQDFQVEVRGDTFYSKQVRKVMIRASDTFTFIQTDKPIYLPGQKVNFRVVAMDNKMRPANQLDPNSNRIGQWLNETSNSRILQLSYSLDTEAREGPYQIIVSMGERNISHNFKVEKYGKSVLFILKFFVVMECKLLIGQEDVEAKVCVHRHGQPVPGRVTVNNVPTY
uniref:Macroglobulin domain-containing protein n=1 Tax=Oreochromis aureus TaxID=47969 RepID=A0AAZ1XH66_OREAU